VFEFANVINEWATWFLQCGSQRSVAPIKTGFVARVSRRKTWEIRRWSDLGMEFGAILLLLY